MPATNMIARLNRATRNAVATLFMMRVSFYCGLEGGGVVEDGRRWTYRSVEDWADEIGESPHKVERTLKLLREANLIATRMAWVGKGHARRWLLHVALTPRTESVLKGEDPQICGEGSCKSAGGGPANLQVTEEQGKLHGDLPGDTSEHSLAGEPGGVSTKSFFGEGDQPVKMEEWQTKQPWKDKAAKLLHKPNAPQTLELLWKEELSAATGGSFVANLTGKQKGQIGHFRKACPKGTAEKVMTWTIKNWVFFTKRVQVQQSVKFIPAHPTLDFLLQYVGTAVTLATPPKTPPKHEATP